MGKKDTPAVPDYTGAANAQAAASKELNTDQTWANRPTINTPWGSQTWNTNSQIDPSTGKPVTNWTSDVTLSGPQQQALDSQMAIQNGRSGAAQQLLGQATQGFQTPMDWSKLPASASSSGGDWRQIAQDAVTKLQAPGLAESREAMQSQLANQGIPMGSEAYASAMRGVGDNENRAALAAIAAGRDEGVQTGQFSNQNRQQAIAEGQLQRSQPLNELNALLTGQQVNSPNMPSFNPSGKSETPNLLGAAQSQYQGGLDQFNANQAGLTGAMSGLFGLGSAAVSNPAVMSSLFALSDRRLKKEIVPLFTLPNGIVICKYRMIGKESPELGVIAQDVQEIMPDAVRADELGFLRVNYEMVLA